MVDGRIEGSLAWVILGGLAFASLMVKFYIKLQVYFPSFYGSSFCLFRNICI